MANNLAENCLRGPFPESPHATLSGDRVDFTGSSVEGALRNIIRHPKEVLLRRWNWKSALFSSICRAAVFFLANLTASVASATGAMAVEFAYRAVTAGFYGALTQAFRSAKPRKLATAVVMLGVPAISHAIEFTLHWIRGTPNLKTSMIASVSFTIVSTLFNLHAMRAGVLIVGEGQRSLRADLRCLPRTICSFAASGCGLFYRETRRRSRP